VVLPTTLLTFDPEIPFNPLHPTPPTPPALPPVHDDAFVDDHVRYVVPPGVTEVGLAVIVAVGGGVTTLTVTVAGVEAVAPL
jgi:hypothetical protein